MNNSEKLQSQIQKKLTEHPLFKDLSFLDQGLGRNDHSKGLCLTFRVTRLDLAPCFMAYWTDLSISELQFSSPGLKTYYSTLDAQRDFILESFLYLIAKNGFHRLIDLEFREWEHFLRLKNREPIVDHEHQSTLEQIFFQLKMELIGHFFKKVVEIKYESLFEDFREPLSYETANRNFLNMIHELNCLLDHPDCRFEAIECVGDTYFFKVTSKSKNLQLSSYLESVLTKKYSFGSILPLKLVAQE